jgi:hypothetical protein
MSEFLTVDGTCVTALAALRKPKAMDHHMNVVKVTQLLILYSGKIYPLSSNSSTFYSTHLPHLNFPSVIQLPDIG